MFGNVFYRDEPYKMVTHARVFTLLPLQFSLDRQLGEFFEAQISKACAGYDYNNMCSFAKIRDKEINIPVNPDGTPNFDYMERYIRAIEKMIIANMVKYKDKVIEATKRVVKI